MPPTDLRTKRILQFAILVVVVAYTFYAQWRRGGENPADAPAPAEPPASVQEEAPEITERPELPHEPQGPSRQEPEAAEPRGSFQTERNSPSGEKPVSPPAQPSAIRLTTSIEGQVIRDLDGEVVFRGTVDLSATLKRIQEGRLLSFRNDGTVFQNREKRLPNKPSGHYREYVHPTPNLGGPGPQRVVKGNQGEYFYTPDHYRTFRKLNR